MAKSVIKRRIIVSYLTIAGVLLLVFGTIVAVSVLAAGKEEVRLKLENNNSELLKVSDLLLNSVYISMHDSFVDDSSIRQALYASELDDFQRNDIHDDLERMVVSSPIAESIYVYNKNQNMIYSSLGTPKALDDFWEEGLIRKLSEAKGQGAIFLSREVVMDDMTLNYEGEVISFVFTDNGNINRDSSFMVVNIAKSRLNEIIYSDTSFGDAINSFVLNNQGDFLLFSNEEMSRDPQYRSMLNEVRYSVEGEGSIFTRFDGQPYTISYAKSGKWGLAFISMASSEHLLTEVYQRVRLIAGLTVLLSLLGVLLALYISKTIYRPIGKMVQEIKGFETLLSNSYSNEYEFIMESIGTMKAEIGNLEDEVSDYIPAMKNSLLKRLLNGSSTDTEILAANGVCLDAESFAVLIFRIDGFSGMKKEGTAKDLMMYRNRLTSLAETYLKPGFNVFTVEDSLEYLPAIISISNDRVSWLMDLKEQIQCMQKEFEGVNRLTFTTGIGQIVFSPECLQKSYQDAMDVTNYRIIYGNSSIITNQDIREAKRSAYAYPHNIEKKIVDHLKAANRERLQPLMLEFTEALTGFEYNEILQSYSQLTLVIVRTARQMNYRSNKDLRINYIDMQNRLNSCQHIDEINRVLYELMESIIDRQSREKVSKHHELITRVKDYIKEHFEEEELCIELLAERESFSVNYLRSIFKNEVGVSLSDYINQVRFEKAQQLLLETKHPAKKIAVMCGFSSTDYFYYAFKKHTGQSPTVYRKEHQHQLVDTV